jgi:hypothetical protein
MGQEPGGLPDEPGKWGEPGELAQVGEHWANLAGQAPGTGSTVDEQTEKLYN